MVKIGMLIADRYEVLEKIGTGGMSVVYRAKDHKLNRYVAIKALKQEFCDNASFVSKFRVEAQAAAGLMHPNIVNVYDVGDEKGMYYIVMELVDGITLKKYIEKKARLSVKEAISIAIQVSMGLEAAHNNHIIHRDIKPQNIIISRDGKVKVTDFGIAKAATSNTITSNVMGSVHYTSPEQARGGYSDEKSDIYSLGVTLFEMLTGRVPFNGETTVAIAIKHIQTPMPSPREFVADIPVSVEQIVLKCCEKSPDRRYQNMQDLIADLKQSLIHPNDNFVRVIHPDEQSATRVTTPREREDIRKQMYDDPSYDERDYEGDERDSYRDYEYEDEIADSERYDSQDAYESERYNSRDPYDDRDEYDEVYEQREKKRRNTARSEVPVRKKADVRKRYDSDDYDRDYRKNNYDPRKEKLITILSVVAAVIIGVVIIIFAASRFGLLDFGSKDDSITEKIDTVTVPTLIGQDAETIRQQLSSMGLTAEITYEKSDDYAAGLIIEASVEDGAQVPAGSTISLVASAGENGVEVPDVTGMTLAEAMANLQKKGFLVEREEGVNEDVEKGLVYEQVPAGNTTAPGSSTILIRISLGPDTEGMVQVPTVTGLTREDAMASLTEAGLTLGQVTEVDVDDPNLGGVVSSQSIDPGEYVDPDTVIDLEIGKETETEPSSYSYSAQIAAPSLAEAPEYVSGTQVYLVIIAADGQKLLDTTTATFPVPVGFTGIQVPSGTLSMSFPSASAAGGQRVITRALTFTPDE